ncbi:ABC transporter permease subunit [Paenibacillus sp. HJL G12]|uniref:ABC transporter permease subunit n=1 Tax=Paenibacillus dendrobii TaxID=2691084 RepID=A0A7X3IG47_9BACL|nr:ABC transporter permease [Paenibacillus dendrobii]MWV43210.1 ABC transporter permease subunit [Paenibacillus dendrobii]
MIQLMQSDWQRMWKRKKTMVSLLIFVGIVLLDCLFLMMQNLGAFDNVSTVPLTAQNFSLFLLKEVSFFLVLIIGPILMIDSFNGEYHGGQLRLVLIRPISVMRLFAAKWINLAIIMGMFVLVTFTVGEIFGHLFKPSVDSVVFLNPDRSYSSAGAFMYCLESYGLFMLIVLAQLSLTGLICTVLPSPIICYLGWVGVAVGSMYVSNTFSFLLFGMSTIFQWMAGSYSHAFIMPLFGCMILGLAVTMFWWNRRNWVK